MPIMKLYLRTAVKEVDDKELRGDLIKGVVRKKVGGEEPNEKKN